MEGGEEIFCAFKIEKNIIGIDSPNVNYDDSDVSQDLNFYLDVEITITEDKSFSLFQLVKESLFTPLISGRLITI